MKKLYQAPNLICVIVSNDDILTESVDQATDIVLNAPAEWFVEE